jgi:hypothetical protein
LGIFSLDISHVFPVRLLPASCPLLLLDEGLDGAVLLLPKRLITRRQAMT